MAVISSIYTWKQNPSSVYSGWKYHPPAANQFVYKLFTCLWELAEHFHYKFTAKREQAFLQIITKLLLHLAVS